MSRETINWLNNNTLIGFSEKRGKAWHYRQGSDNHYVGGVPMDDVRKRLFDWHAEEQPIIVGETVDMSREGDSGPVDLVLPGPVVPGYKAWVHPKTGEVLGVHKSTRALHQYDEWLLDVAEPILGQGVEIGTAGVLRGGRIAWVQFEVPETFTTPEGVTFRPFVLARSSMDASVATTWSRSITNTVCDNTMALAATEHGGQRIVFRASGDNAEKLAGAREALGLIDASASDFTRQVGELTATRFSASDFEKLAKIIVPGERPEQSNTDKNWGRAWAYWTKVQQKRAYLADLWAHDERVAPWTGTAFGAWQAFNTYDQHERVVRGNRVERNQLQVVKGTQDRQDAAILKAIMELAA
jgi:phage/plasmid-like protein (TIGR03299 family)